MRIDRTRFVVAMLKRDCTTVQLADKTGLSRGTVSAVKNGKRCSDKTGNLIAKALGVAVEDLMEQEEL